MRAAVSRALAVLQRVTRDPTLVPEVWRKLHGRLIARRYQRRTRLYAELAVPCVDGLARMLDVEPAVVQTVMNGEPLRGYLADLEAYRVPQQARAMGGAAFLEVCYTIVRLTRPKVVLETGVAHGYSTAIMLHALEDNNEGELHSVDLPMFLPGVAAFTGGAVPPRLRASPRWELLVGSDRQVLPSLLKRIGLIDCFLYDSDKSYEGMLHTWRLVWPHLRPGAVLVLDDVQAHDAFLDFVGALGLTPLIIPKPARQGVYRWDDVYYVGLVRKPQT
ncbi:MAG: class I SAM-dependent methyltransferase [Armatimonadetes bacterium]|nr:class I SAM-dependent methyltransferase [Armatimonadota bacterium]